MRSDVPRPVRDPASGCLLWQGRIDRNGYGKRGARWAHSVAWEEAHGQPVPPGSEVHHTCTTPPCVEPAHLEALTVAEHKARHRPTACRACGAEDWYQRRDGGRQCRSCKRKRAAR